MSDDMQKDDALLAGDDVEVEEGTDEEDMDEDMDDEDEDSMDDGEEETV